MYRKSILSYGCLMACCALLLIPSKAFATETLKDTIQEYVNTKQHMDFDQMVKIRAIRILIPYSKTFYFIDGARQMGASYDMVKAFEKNVNTQLKTKHLKIHTVFIPTPRDRLIPALAEGLGDIAVGNLTITEKRLEQVDFCDPGFSGVNEILVTGPQSPTIKSFLDLSGKVIHVRKSSSYYDSLEKANKRLKAEGKPGVEIVLASENLEDEDLLEMLDAGLIPMVVIDSHKGKFWTQIFKNIVLHPQIKLRESGKIAWAIQKNTPLLKEQVNAFVKKNKKGTLMGNMIFNKYLKNTKYVKNNLSGDDRKRFDATIELFKKYSGQYKFDWLMIAALAYQESTIDQSKRSHVGAIGVMQILPTTAKDKNVNIPNIEEIEANIHAGVKYLRFMMDRYFDDPAIDRLDRALFTFASYNAGPAKLAKLRKEAKRMNLNPNKWFGNVEVVAAKRIGRETVQYVSNIFKYYIAYTFIVKEQK